MPKSKHHVRGSLKKTNIFFPAHPATTMLQADELLFHFPPAVWAYFITLSHRLQIQTVGIQKKVHNAHYHDAFLVAP